MWSFTIQSQKMKVTSPLNLVLTNETFTCDEGLFCMGVEMGTNYIKSFDYHYALCIEEWFDISPWGSQKQQILIYAINMNMVLQISYFETCSSFNVVLCVYVVILNECLFYCIICVDNYERTIGLWWCLNHNVQYGYIQHC